MKRNLIILSLGLLLLSALPVDAQRPLLYVAFGSEQVTVAGTAIGFTASTIAPVGGSFRANVAVCTTECSTTSPCPFRYNSISGVTPTASVGLIVNAASGSDLTVTTYGWDNITNFKAIRTGANSVLLSCIYYR